MGNEASLKTEPSEKSIAFHEIPWWKNWKAF